MNFSAEVVRVVKSSDKCTCNKGSLKTLIGYVTLFNQFSKLNFVSKIQTLNEYQTLATSPKLPVSITQMSMSWQD